MKIRTRLYILAAVAVGLVAALVVVTYVTAETVEEKTRTHELAHEMQVGVYELDLLKEEYLREHDPAVEQEWESLYHETAWIVGEEMGVEPRAEYALYGDLFRELTISCKREQRLIEAGAPTEDIQAAVLAQEELVPQLIERSRSILEVTSEITEVSFAEMIAAQERERNATLGLSLSLAGAVAATAVVTTRRISRPLNSLAEYTRRVGSGDYNAGVEVSGSDEIAAITSDVKAMVKKLLATQRKLLLTDSAIESANTGIAISDLEGNLTYVNPAFLEMFGYGDADEVVGRPAAGFWREPAEAREVIGALVNRNQPKSTELVALKKDGTEFIADFRAFAITDEGGRPQALGASFTDVTGKRKTERELRDIFENSKELVCTAGLDGYFRRINPAFEKTLGYSEEELLSRPFFELIHPDDYDSTIAAINELEEGKTVANFDNRFRCKDGSFRWLSWNIIASDEVALFRAIGRDVTDIKVMQDRLVESERMAMLGQFSGNISHEVRNPLGVIDSSAYYLKTKLKDADGKIHEHLDRIKSSVAGATATIESLLNLTRMEAPRLSRIDLRSVLNDAVKTSRIPGGVQVVKDMPGEEVAVDADGEQLRMAFKNIIKNACQAMEGKGTLAIAFSSGPDGWAELTFADTGPGIAHDDLEEIFRPLVSRKAQGIGFGLSIARMVVDKHGGEIRAESAKGKGATIVIRIPLFRGGEEKEV